jgi:acetyltransferase-like isoleucine patch superfamily enzyme
LVRFLQEQADLANTEPLILDPVIMLRRERITFGQGTRVDSFCKLEGGDGMVIGRYVHIASFAHLGIGGGTTVLGDFSAVASGGKVISGSNEVDATSMSATAPAFYQRVTKSKTVIGPYAVVLCNAVVLPGVTLGEGAVLAAGAVATRDIPPWEIWGGVPAKFMAKRVVVTPSGAHVRMGQP